MNSFLRNLFQYFQLVDELEKDALMKTLKNHPEYNTVIQKIKDRFWENHNQLKTSLRGKALI